MKKAIIGLAIVSIFLVISCKKKSKSSDESVPPTANNKILSPALGEDIFPIAGTLAFNVNQTESLKMQLTNAAPPSSVMGSDMSIPNNSSLAIDGLALTSNNEEEAYLADEYRCTFNQATGMYICDGMPTNCDCDSCIPVKDEIVNEIAASNPEVKKLYLCYPPQIDVTLGLLNSPHCAKNDSCNSSLPVPSKISSLAKKIFHFEDTARDSDSMDTSNFDAAAVKKISYQCRKQKWKPKNDFCMADSAQSNRNCFYGMMDQFCPTYFKSDVLGNASFSWNEGKQQHSSCSSFPNFMDNISSSYTSQEGARSCYLSELSYQSNYLKYDNNLLRDRNLIYAFECLLRKQVANTLAAGGEQPLAKVGDIADLKEIANTELAALDAQYPGCFGSGDYNAPSISDLKVTYDADSTKNEAIDPIHGSLDDKTDITFKKYSTDFTLSLGFTGPIGQNNGPECGTLTPTECYCVACYYGSSAFTSWCASEETDHGYSLAASCGGMTTTSGGSLICKESIAQPFGAADYVPIFPYPKARVTLSLKGTSEVSTDGDWVPRVYGSMSYSIADGVSFDSVGTAPTNYLIMKTFADWEQIGPAKEILISNTTNYGMGRCKISTGGTGNCTFENAQLVTANYYPECRMNYCELPNKNCQPNNTNLFTGIDSREDADVSFSTSKWIVETGRMAGKSEYTNIRRVFPGGMQNQPEERTHTALLKRTGAEEEDLPGCMMMQDSFVDSSQNGSLTSRYANPRVECWDTSGNIKTGSAEYIADSDEKKIVVTSSSDSMTEAFDKMLSALKN